MGMMNSINNISGTLPNADKLVELMFQDKKVVNGKLNLILAKGIGKAFIARDVDPNLIKDVINNLLQFDNETSTCRGNLLTQVLVGRLPSD